MDFNNNIGEAEDRISKLPDPLIHHILSFLESQTHSVNGTKCVARTCILSKRWNGIWKSIPTLIFPVLYPSPSLSEINKFIDFVDTTLLLRDPSTIKKIHLYTNKHFNASRIHSWMENLSRRKIEDLDLRLAQDKCFYVPSSLFNCESLIKLKLISGNLSIHLPKIFSFPKLKSLILRGIQLTDDNCWDEQHFSNCPVLENLILEDCTWIGVRNLCISTPTLKFLELDTSLSDGVPAKEYVLPSFQTLKSADIQFHIYDELREAQIGYDGSITKFIRALSNVECLTLYPESLKTLSMIRGLPTFHNLKELSLQEDGKTTDRSLFAFLNAAPNLTRLVFEYGIHDSEEEENNWDSHMLTARRLFQHLQSVWFGDFSGKAKEMRWLKLILKNAKALQIVTVVHPSYLVDAKTKEVLMSEFPSLPKASDGCVLNIH